MPPSSQKYGSLNPRCPCVTPAKQPPHLAPLNTTLMVDDFVLHRRRHSCLALHCPFCLSSRLRPLETPHVPSPLYFLQFPSRSSRPRPLGPSAVRALLRLHAHLAPLARSSRQLVQEGSTFFIPERLSLPLGQPLSFRPALKITQTAPLSHSLLGSPRTFLWAPFPCPWCRNFGRRCSRFSRQSVLPAIVHHQPVSALAQNPCCR